MPHGGKDLTVLHTIYSQFLPPIPGVTVSLPFTFTCVNSQYLATFFPLDSRLSLRAIKNKKKVISS